MLSVHRMLRIEDVFYLATSQESTSKRLVEMNKYTTAHTVPRPKKVPLGDWSALFRRLVASYLPRNLLSVIETRKKGIACTDDPHVGVMLRRICEGSRSMIPVLGLNSRRRGIDKN